MKHKQREAAAGKERGQQEKCKRTGKEKGGGLAKIKYVGKCHTETHYFVCWF